MSVWERVQIKAKQSLVMGGSYERLGKEQTFLQPFLNWLELIACVGMNEKVNRRWKRKRKP